MINKHKSNKIKENSNTMRHLNNGTDHRHSKSCCDQNSPARRTIKEYIVAKIGQTLWNCMIHSTNESLIFMDGSWDMTVEPVPLCVAKWRIILTFNFIWCRKFDGLYIYLTGLLLLILQASIEKEDAESNLASMVAFTTVTGSCYFVYSDMIRPGFISISS